jgi:hypothetical protein
MQATKIMNTTKSNWSFVHVADMHVGMPRSYRFQPAWNENWQTARRQIIGLNPDFLLVGGDMTRDGATHRLELEQIKADLDRLPFPYYVIPGNHEVGNKFLPSSEVSIQADYVRLYKSVFGDSQWSFIHNGVRFSGFDAFLAGSGLPKEQELWRWFEEQICLPKERFHVWVMHPALFIDALREPNWDIQQDYEAWYFGVDEPFRSRIMRAFLAAKSEQTLVITAHIHCRRRVVARGVVFQYAPSTAFPQWAERWPDGDASPGFLHCLVSETGIEPKFVPLEKLSSKKGYGPGGNPSLKERDYSIAWEKPALNLDEQRFPENK